MNGSSSSSSADWDKIGRYLSGESTPEETAIVRRWLEEHPSDAEALAALDTAVREVPSPAGVDVEAALRRVKTRMHPRLPTPVKWRRYAGFAAAATVVLAAGLLVSRSTARTRTAARAYVTSVGERKEILLPDGTQVILGPATKLSVRGRQVELTGEAFFSVLHDSLRPFSVRAGDAVIRDIGTEFTVHTDPGAAVRVVVSQGVVRVTHDRDSVDLARGDVATVAIDGRVQTSRGAATDDDLAWTTGKLVFRNSTMTEVVADLRRWYGVDLRVTDSALLRRHFTGSFTREPADRVLDVIALALGAKIDRRGDTAFVRTASPAR